MCGDTKYVLFFSATLLSAICHSDSRGAEVKQEMGWKGGKKPQRIKTVENITHTHCDKSVYFTFVSRTDIILSLASLTFSLFPHTLMWGSAGGENKQLVTLKGKKDKNQYRMKGEFVSWFVFRNQTQHSGLLLTAASTLRDLRNSHLLLWFLPTVIQIGRNDSLDSGLFGEGRRGEGEG